MDFSFDGRCSEPRVGIKEKMVLEMPSENWQSQGRRNMGRQPIPDARCSGWKRFWNGHWCFPQWCRYGYWRGGPATVDPLAAGISNRRRRKRGRGSRELQELQGEPWLPGAAGAKAVTMSHNPPPPILTVAPGCRMSQSRYQEPRELQRNRGIFLMFLFYCIKMLFNEIK